MLEKVELNEKSALRNFDQVFERISHYGRYQLFVFLVFQYLMLNAAGNYLFMSFGGLYRTCDDLEWNLETVKDVCTMVKNCPQNASSTSYFYSLYEDENFVCPNSGLPQHLQSLQAIGSGIGALVGGHAADQLGRKLISTTGAILMILSGLLGALSPDWMVLAVAMFGMGFSYGILIDAALTLATETVGPKFRIVQTLAVQWSVAMQIASVIAYFAGSWRLYLIVINVAVVPALFLLNTWVESPRWLIQKRDLKTAAICLNKIAARNQEKVRFTEDDLKEIELDDGNQKLYSVWHLFMTRQLFLYSIVMILSALTAETTIAVILFDVQSLAGNPFLNVALYGTLRMWVPLFIIFLEKYSNNIGRRALFIYSQTFTVLCFTIFLILPSTFPYQSMIKTVLALVGGIVNASIFFTVYKQYSMELYPTLMRAMAVGTFGVVERIGGGLSPQLVYLSRVFWPGFGVCVATVFCAASLIAGFFVLPETKNRTMPDTLRQEENLEKVDEECK
ncbi:unnamed protein product, partial [Mesorhabditis spiculigera]